MFRVALLGLGLGLAALPAMADTPEAIRACLAERSGAGCATLLSRIFVCDRAGGIAGCAGLLAARDVALAEPEPEPEPEPEVEPAPDTAADTAADTATETGDCPVIDSADWGATVGPVEGVEGPQLVVTGTVIMPTPGWTVALEPGLADRSALPVQRLRLTATPPDGIVIQVTDEVAVRAVMPALAAYRGVAVDCGDLVLVELTEVGQTR